MANQSPEQLAAAASTIPLSELDPDLLGVLTTEQRRAATRCRLPVLDISGISLELGQLLQSLGAFGAIVLEGALQYQIKVGEQPGMVLAGPGDVLATPGSPYSITVSAAQLRALAATRLVLLGDEFRSAVAQWPRLYEPLLARQAEVARRIATQLGICQLPRIEDRLLSMLWLLAETWGRVTPAGTVLPLSVTHEALGTLVGAARSTVTLAISELAERGALVQQDRSWLLLERPAHTDDELPEVESVRVLADGSSEWSEVSMPEISMPEIGGQLKDTVEQLRAQHVVYREELRRQMGRAVRTRARSQELRERSALARTFSRRPPSSRSPR